MNIEAFLLCDAATDQQGKLNILGAFDVIWAKKMPAFHPSCAIALRIRFGRIEEGDHPVRMIIIDEDGKQIAPKFDGNISVKIPQDSISSVTNFIFNIQGLEIKKYGTYRVDLAVDGDQKAELPFHVRQVPDKP
ncbi:MAG: hypothetical protein PVG93_03695 [Phycisphaerales bacterium]|jgi:hypothetical protein